MRIATWNVNGLRAALKKGFMDFIAACGADVYCIQETKMHRGQAEVRLPPGCFEYWNSADKKGYSGTAAFSRTEPLSAAYGIGEKEHDTEGRVITLEYDDFYLVNEYTPNSRNSEEGLVRLGYRMEWEDARREYLKTLDAKKPVVLCGDLNVAHEEIDLKNPGPNRGNAGFSDEERAKFSELLAAGFTDAFRFLYPGRKDAYTWWSYRSGARERNIGWRIDYFVVSNRIAAHVKDVTILVGTAGSDHCPVLLDIDT
jgi:exodeoxyribonuclease-3